MAAPSQFFTYSRQVPLSAGQSVGFTRGKGYYSRTPPPPPGLNLPSQASLSSQAGQLASQSVAAQIAAIQAQQQQALQQAQDRANQINQASLAAAHFLEGMGGQTYGSYKDAATTLAGLTGGFSGQLKDDASAQANQVQQDLNSVGSPQTAVNQGASLANLLYGQRGQQAASVLLQSGLGAAQAENAQPLALIGQGQQLALGALGAGKQTSDSLLSNILQAQAQTPSLQQQYLASLTDSASKRQTAAQQAALFPLLVGSQQAGITQKQAAAEAALANAQTAAKRADIYGQASAANAQTAAQRARIDQQRANAYDRSVSLQGATAKQRAEVALYNAQTARYKATHPTPKTLSAQQTQTYKGTAARLADQAFHGFTPAPTKADPKPKYQPALDYMQALDEAAKEGIPASIAIPALRRWYRVYPNGVRIGANTNPRTNPKAAGPPAPKR